MIRKAFPLLAALSLTCIVGSASAQVDTPPTKLEKQLHKLDLSVSGVGIYNTTVNGTVTTNLGASNSGASLTQFGSNTAGALVSLHYVAKPYFGLEINYGYARYTENFAGPALNNFVINPFLVQTKVNEYTFGYLVTPRTLYSAFSLSFQQASARPASRPHPAVVRSCRKKPVPPTTIP